jgi:hypothetical protein
MNTESQSLVNEANEIAERHSLVLPRTMSEVDKLAYIWILAALKHTDRNIVGDAMKLRFGMSDEDFAIDILGG